MNQAWLHCRIMQLPWQLPTLTEPQRLECLATFRGVIGNGRHIWEVKLSSYYFCLFQIPDNNGEGGNFSLWKKKNIQRFLRFVTRLSNCTIYSKIVFKSTACSRNAMKTDSNVDLHFIKEASVVTSLIIPVKQEKRGGGGSNLEKTLICSSI